MTRVFPQPCAYNHATVPLSRGSRIGRYEIVGHPVTPPPWLQRVKDARSAGIMLANSERNFAAYRSDPTFQGLLGPAFVDERGR